jgi:hypothetical protein
MESLRNFLLGEFTNHDQHPQNPFLPQTCLKSSDEYYNKE